MKPTTSEQLKCSLKYLGYLSPWSLKGFLRERGQIKLTTHSLLVSLILITTGCQSQSPQWLTGYKNQSTKLKTPRPIGVDLQLINTTGEIVEFQVSGLSWEEDTTGPNLTAVLGTDQKTSYDYGKTITINYPILVHWRGLATGKTQSWAITGVGGTGEKETTLKGDGLLVIGLSPQYQLNSFFLRDVNATEKEAFQVVRTGHR